MGGSRQSSLARQVENQASSQADQLDTLGLSQMQTILNALQGKLGGDWGKIPGEVKLGYDKVRASTEEAFNAAKFGSAESAQYLAKTSGGNISGGEVNEQITQDAYALDQRRRLLHGQINVDEANTAMSANNGFMRLMAGAGQSALGLASTYQNQALQGTTGVNNTSPWQSALGGAAAGASVGSAFPGWGTAIGAVVGGVGGYFAGR